MSVGDIDARSKMSSNNSRTDHRRERVHSERRDSVVEEMNKKFNIKKRKHDAVIKLRKMNSVAKTLLDGRISIMQTSYQRQERRLTKETRDLENELKKLRPNKSTLPPIHAAATNPTSSSTSLERGQSLCDLTCNECRFGTSKGMCKNFPCTVPVTYTSIGYGNQLHPRSYSRLSHYGDGLMLNQQTGPKTQTQEQDKDAELPGYKPNRARISIEDRERGLRQLVAEMRHRNEQRKPKDWATNYGDPVARRLILKPVVLAKRLAL